MVNLLKTVQANKDDATAKNSAAVLFQTAVLESGFEITDPTFLVSNIYGLMSKSLGVDPEAPLAEIELPEEEEEEEEEKAEDSETDKDGDDDEEEVVAEEDNSESESDKNVEEKSESVEESEKDSDNTNQNKLSHEFVFSVWSGGLLLKGLFGWTSVQNIRNSFHRKLERPNHIYPSVSLQIQQWRIPKTIS